jgi:pyridoxal phosphate enzyme (YggS family)
MTISENIEKVKSKIKAAALSAGRDENDVELVAVSKKVGADRIKIAMDCGVQSFGENYVQEFREKKEILTNVKWHFIGQLQSNKVKYIFRDISMLHSLDRLSLAAELDKRLSAENRRLKALLQINIGREPQKGGVMPEDVKRLLSELAAYESLDVCGLMCMPPFSNTEDETIRDFAATKKIYDDMLGAGFKMRYLSMGMSGDYEDAVKQGANIVRVGSAIFGERK